MKEATKIALEWVLIDSNASREIKVESLRALLDAAEESIEVHGFKLSKEQYKAICLETRKVPAIKLFRQATDAGLSECKNAIEQYFGM